MENRIDLLTKLETWEQTRIEIEQMTQANHFLDFFEVRDGTPIIESIEHPVDYIMEDNVESESTQDRKGVDVGLGGRQPASSKLSRQVFLIRFLVRELSSRGSAIESWEGPGNSVASPGRRPGVMCPAVRLAHRFALSGRLPAALRRNAPLRARRLVRSRRSRLYGALGFFNWQGTFGPNDRPRAALDRCPPVYDWNSYLQSADSDFKVAIDQFDGIISISTESLVCLDIDPIQYCP
jgi:hypothetical protein